MRPSERGGYGLDAMWNDDFHHSAMVAVTGHNLLEPHHFEFRHEPGPSVGIARSVSVRFTENGDPIDAKVLGTDPSTDIALLKVDPSDVEGGVKPLELADSNPELDSLIMYGDEDGLVADSFAIDFVAALVGSGATALLEKVEGARHNDMHNPVVVGDLIVTWLDR